ncbi:MAG: hypothetical protein RTU92_04915 [Candidatus Thorarchaeota archaeon]
MPISIFSLPKGFDDPSTDLAQRNSIQSWMYLVPRPEIILLGDDPGVAEVTREYNLVHAPQIELSSHGNPLIRSLLEVGQETSSNEIVCFISCDIIVPPNLQECILVVADLFEKFLTVALRRDTRITYAIDFTNDNWANKLPRGKAHQPWAIDFYGFRKGLWSDIPPFAIGRSGWDNYLMTKALEADASVVDLTKVVRLTHQNHVRTTKTPRIKDPDALLHRELIKGVVLSSIEQATHIMERKYLISPNG